MRSCCWSVDSLALSQITRRFGTRSSFRQAFGFSRVNATNTQVPLRKGDFNASFPQSFSDSNGDIALELKPRVLPGRPEAKLKVQLTFAKSHEESRRRAFK